MQEVQLVQIHNLRNKEMEISLFLKKHEIDSLDTTERNLA